MKHFHALQQVPEISMCNLLLGTFTQIMSHLMILFSNCNQMKLLTCLKSICWIYYKTIVSIQLERQSSQNQWLTMDLFSTFAICSPKHSTKLLIMHHCGDSHRWLYHRFLMGWNATLKISVNDHL